DDDEGDDGGEERVLVVPDQAADEVGQGRGDGRAADGQGIAAAPGGTGAEPPADGRAEPLAQGERSGGGGQLAGRGGGGAHGRTGSCSRICSSSPRSKESPSRAPRPTTMGASR